MAVFLGVFLTIGVFAQNAQKFGHVNSAALLEMMPEVDVADKQLAAFQEGLIKGGEAKVRTFEANYKKFQENVKAGTLSKVQQQDRQNALAEEQESISQYEAQVQFQVMQRREELLKPILQKVDEAIQAEGKAGEYTFVFDSSVAGALLFAIDGDDIMEPVKKRLGIQ
jgi:outer membrane protein